MQIDFSLMPQGLRPKAERLFELSAPKILAIEETWDPARGTPVFTVQGRYTTRGWTEWTQGFQFGSALLQFDATGDERFLEIGRQKTLAVMAPHVSHVGVHDHGFNNISTYGNLLRLMREGRVAQGELKVPPSMFKVDAGGPETEKAARGTDWERDFYELALKVSGAVQAARWTDTKEERGYIYSFNGPHSLFADTIRSLRSLAVAHQLGHGLMAEADRKISLLQRLIVHAETTARFNVYYGEGRDAYDVRGRVAHESIFNVRDGNYRCPSTQQGYSPFTTWTRGHAWIVCGYAEQLEFLQVVPDAELDPHGGRAAVEELFLKPARATCDFYLQETPRDGIPYWDSGAPNLHRLGDYLDRPADPFNDHEPVDSSAAAIAAQGLLRLGRYLRGRGEEETGTRYYRAALTVANALFDRPYLSEDNDHQGLLLHSVYHRPNGWDYVPPGAKQPRGESAMWGDYHARELALLILREANGGPYPTFYSS